MGGICLSEEKKEIVIVKDKASASRIEVVSSTHRVRVEERKLCEE